MILHASFYLMKWNPEKRKSVIHVSTKNQNGIDKFVLLREVDLT